MEKTVACCPLGKAGVKHQCGAGHDHAKDKPRDKKKYQRLSTHDHNVMVKS